MKQPEKALAAFKTCYQLDSSQKDILETICKLLLELTVDPGTLLLVVPAGLLGSLETFCKLLLELTVDPGTLLLVIPAAGLLGYPGNHL